MELIEDKFPHYSEEGKALVRRAWQIASDALKDDLRDNGHPFLEHPMNVALIVSDEIGLQAECAAAVFLHETLRKHPDYDIKSAGFPSEVYKMVEGLDKIATIKPKDTRLEAENYKKLIVQYSTDPRVTVLKIADRLEVMRHLEMFPKLSRERKILETLMLYIPLAHQLGLYNIKSELEDIYFRFADPVDYRLITNKLKATEKDRVKLSEEFIRPLEKKLSDAGIRYKLKIRTKTAYSIYKKMQKQKVPFEGVYDVFAIRFIIDCDTDHKSEVDLCWKVYSYVTEEYEPDTHRLRDWLSNPKPNGYESLHITVKNKDNAFIEVQIRTKRMDDIAEKGIAAHWAYKQDGYISENDNEMDKWLSKVKEILVSPDVNALELLDIIHNDLTTTSISVFTPKGEQKSIQKGATALDFAFMIHSQIGCKAIAAKVNMKLVPLSYVLKTGDQVEIISAEDEHPKTEWLSFLQTRHAKNQVLDYFRPQRAAFIEAGRKDLEERLTAMGKKFDDNVARKIAAALEVNNADEFLFRYGIGYLNFENVLSTLQSKKKKQDEYVINSTEDGHKYVIADCCKPIPGDAVVGFMSADGTIVVHKKSCSVAETLATKHGDRIVKTHWEADADQSFPVRISLTGIDRIGLLNDITGYISLVMGVNMRRLDLNTEGGIFDGYIDMYVHDRDVLETMITNLKNIKGVQSVIRTEI